MGLAALFYYRGDIVLAEAARACDVRAIMSGSSLIRLEEVMEPVPGSWFKACLPGDQAAIDALLAAQGPARVSRPRAPELGASAHREGSFAGGNGRADPPFAYAAAVAGQAGVEHAIRLICGELSRNMRMMGAVSLDGFDATCLVENDR